MSKIPVLPDVPSVEFDHHIQRHLGCGCIAVSQHGVHEVLQHLQTQGDGRQRTADRKLGVRGWGWGRALTTFTLLFLCLALMFLMSVTMCVYRVWGDKAHTLTQEQADLGEKHKHTGWLGLSTSLSDRDLKTSKRCSKQAVWNQPGESEAGTLPARQIGTTPLFATGKEEQPNGHLLMNRPACGSLIMHTIIHTTICTDLEAAC